VKVVYVPYPYIPNAVGGGNIQFVSDDGDEPIQTPVPSKRPSDAVKIIYIPVFTEGADTRSESSDEEEAIVYVKTPASTRMPSKIPTKSPTAFPTKVPTKMPSANPSAKPSISPTFKPSAGPSSSPTSDPSAPPTDERWCNLEYERGCRDKCFKERGCGTNEGCKKKCRVQCCTWN